MMKKVMMVAVLALGLVLMSIPAFATPLSVFDNWTQIADDDGHVGPGGGGQLFDAEYLFYQFSADKSKLSIGLQTGFDIKTGSQVYDGKTYYAGDLALSFDDCGANGWEYGVDFGFAGQQDYNNSTPIPDYQAGLYSVNSWNNNVYSGYSSSAPFAIADGTLVVKSSYNFAGFGYTDNIIDSAHLSYCRTVTFDVASITGFPAGIQNIAAHWTMSCGNDVIQGCAPVPEPQTLLLMGIGLLGLAFVGRKRLGDRA